MCPEDWGPVMQSVATDTATQIIMTALINMMTTSLIPTTAGIWSTW